MNIQPDDKAVEDVLGEAVLSLLERNQPVNLNRLRDEVLLLSSSRCKADKQQACTKVAEELSVITSIYPDLPASGLVALNDSVYSPMANVQEQ